MAYYSETVLLNALAELNERSNKDMRAPNYGATKTFNKYKRDVILNYDEFVNVKNQSELQTKQIDYMMRDAGSVASARTALFTARLGVSNRDTLTFTTYAREYALSYGAMKNNTQGAKMLANQIINARLDIGASLETNAVAKLETFKNTTQGGRTLGTWDAGVSVEEFAIANKNEYYNYIRSEMGVLDYNGLFQEVHSSNLTALQFYQLAQGTGNSTNLQFQYPDWDFELSSSVSNASDYFGTSYVVPASTIALLDWVPTNFTEGMKHGIWEFMTIPDPFGILDKVAVAIYQTVVNNSAVGGTAQDIEWLFEMSTDVALFIPTLTTGKIVNKFGLTLA